MYSIVTDNEFFNAIYDQIKFNVEKELAVIDSELKNLKTNISKLESENINLLNVVKSNSDLKNLSTITNELQKLELGIGSITQKIIYLESHRKNISSKTVGKIELKKVLSGYDKIYDQLTIEDKSRLNQLLFSEIVSFFSKKDNDGKIVIKIRGDGKLEKKWSEIRNANLLTQVRTSDQFGSANTIPTQKKIGLNYLFLSQNQQMVDSN